MSDRGSFAPHVPCFCEQCARLHGDQAYEEDLESSGVWFTRAQMSLLVSVLGRSFLSSKDQMSQPEFELVQRVLGSWHS